VGPHLRLGELADGAAQDLLLFSRPEIHCSNYTGGDLRLPETADGSRTKFTKTTKTTKRFVIFVFFVILVPAAVGPSQAS
jgi:hypothetical protein